MVPIVGADGVGLTDIVIAFDVAGLPVVHDRLDVISTVITLPLARAAEI
jgi:hypothetical protein